MSPCRKSRRGPRSTPRARNTRKPWSAVRAEAASQRTEIWSDDLKAKLGMSPIAWWNDDLAELSD
ncbi:hypothetical protein EN792_057955, partial [Mesorhizobium sp. M00.F.Ca.ET.149.01.1.1]